MFTHSLYRSLSFWMQSRQYPLTKGSTRLSTVPQAQNCASFTFLAIAPEPTVFTSAGVLNVPVTSFLISSAISNGAPFTFGRFAGGLMSSASCFCLMIFSVSVLLRCYFVNNCLFLAPYSVMNFLRRIILAFYFSSGVLYFLESLSISLRDASFISYSVCSNFFLRPYFRENSLSNPLDAVPPSGTSLNDSSYVSERSNLTCFVLI